MICGSRLSSDETDEQCQPQQKPRANQPPAAPRTRSPARTAAALRYATAAFPKRVHRASLPSECCCAFSTPARPRPPPDGGRRGWSRRERGRGRRRSSAEEAAARRSTTTRWPTSSVQMSTPTPRGILPMLEEGGSCDPGLVQMGNTIESCLALTAGVEDTLLARSVG